MAARRPCGQIPSCAMMSSSPSIAEIDTLLTSPDTQAPTHEMRLMATTGDTRSLPQSLHRCLHPGAAHIAARHARAASCADAVCCAGEGRCVHSLHRDDAQYTGCTTLARPWKLLQLRQSRHALASIQFSCTACTAANALFGDAQDLRRAGLIAPNPAGPVYGASDDVAWSQPVVAAACGVRPVLQHQLECQWHC